MQIHGDFSLLTRMLLKIYAGAKRSGIVDSSFVRPIFSKSYFLYKRYLDDPFYNFCRKHRRLISGGIILDIGANIGYTACTFAEAAGPDGVVFAFEPDPENFQMLVREVSLRDLRTIVPVRTAVGNGVGSVTLWRNENHHADHRILTEQFRAAVGTSEGLTVPLTSIDTFLDERGVPADIRLIKIDVQGYELPVCEGMASTLRQNPSTLVAFEYAPAELASLGFSPDALLAFFRQRSMDVYTLSQRGNIERVTDTHLHQNVRLRGYVDLLAARCERQLSESAA